MFSVTTGVNPKIDKTNLIYVHVADRLILSQWHLKL